MSVHLFRHLRRLLAVLAGLLLTTAGAVLSAPGASAAVPGPDGGDSSTVVVPVDVPVSRVVHVTDGLQWGAIVLIALGAAIVAALATEIVDTVRNRRHLAGLTPA